MFKSTLKFGSGFFIVLLLISCFIYESDIQQVIPSFQAELLFAGIILIIGWLAALLMRNALVGVFAMFIAGIVPTFFNWLVIYWPY